MKQLLCCVVAIFLLSNCSKDSNKTSDCIQSKISQFATMSCEHGAEVKQYRFQGKLVYVFSMGNCGADLPSGVLDSDCNSLGMLGGLTGNTTINGSQFSSAKFERTIWSR